MGSISDKVFGCRYETKKDKKQKTLQQNTQMFGQRRTGGVDKAGVGKGSGRGGAFFAGGGGGGRGGGRG